MKKSIWNTCVAFGLAVGMAASAPPAFSASKKTPTPSDGSASTATKSDSAAKTAKVNLNTADEKEQGATGGPGVVTRVDRKSVV